MSTEPTKQPDNNPWRLNGGRVVLLVLGVLLLAYIASTFMGGLTNYQQLKEGAQQQKAEQAAPAN